MIKKSLFILIAVFLIIPFYAGAQSIEFIYNGRGLTNNEKITITEYTVDADVGVEMTFKVAVKNKSVKNVTVKVTKEVVSAPAGSTNVFCCGVNCYSANSSDPYDIAAGATNELKGVFSPTTASTAVIKYTASVSGTLDDAISVEVTYQYSPTGIEKVGFTHLFFTQQNGTCTINFNSFSEITLKVFTLLGNTVSSHRLEANEKSFVLPEKLMKGIYIFTFSDKRGNTFSKKIQIN